MPKKHTHKLPAKHHRTKWYEDGLAKLRQQARQKKIAVRQVPQKRLKDYAGMNSEAAKEMGFQMPKRTILVSKSLSNRAKYHTLKHELSEYDSMKRGKRYWPAHLNALKAEKG